VECGWVAGTGRSYRLTPAGEAVYAEFGRLVTTIEAATRLEPFLEWMPDGAFDLDLRHLTDAGLDTFVHDGPVPFFPGLYDDRVQVGVGDDEGSSRALVESRDEAVREWAEDTYAAYRTAAKRLA